jgi:hypothetical protein
VVNRRDFLATVAGSSAALMGQSACAPSPALARLSVDYGNPGRPIPADFTGLSYESAVLAANDFFTPDNRTLIRLLRTLGPHGVLRIGGNTSERTVWGPPTTKVSRERFLVTPGAVDRLALFLRALDWQLIYGLNLATGTAEDAAAEAAYVAAAVGPQLLALQIGNEPDGFGQWSGVRPRGYDVSAFIAEWQRFYRTIRDRVPAARFAGPDVAFDTGWIGPFATAAPDGLVMLTVHHYAGGPASNPSVTLEKLMQAGGQVAPMLATMERLGRTYHLPYRIAETNSIYGGGRPRVSDTLGAALWTADLMFRIAAAGGAGVNFHAGEEKIYTPISHGSRGGLVARVPYYGMLMFGRGSDGALVPAQIDGGSDALSAYAVRAGDGALRISVINRDLGRTSQVSIDPGHRFGGGDVLRLAGAAADGPDATFGGATLDDYGGWSATAEEPVHLSGSEFLVEVPAASAATVVLAPA